MASKLTAHLGKTFEIPGDNEEFRGESIVYGGRVKLDLGGFAAEEVKSLVWAIFDGKDCP